MGRCRRMGDEALRVSEIVRDVDEPQRIEKTEAGLLAAGDIETDQAAALLHLTARELVLGMARQPGIEHSCDFGMAVEVLGDCRSRAALSFDPQFQRLKSLQKQPRVERAQRRPGMPV